MKYNIFVKYPIYAIFLIIFFWSCQSKQFKQLSFLEGTWTRKTEKTQSLEIWVKINNETLNGKGIRLKNETGDTLFVEKLEIVKKKEGIFYVATVPSQNDGKSISFKLKSIQSKEAIFENQKHDFPKKIQYVLKNQKLYIKVSGVENQKKKAFELILDKKK